MADLEAPKPFYTLAEFAKRLLVSYSTAKRMADAGDVRRVRVRTGGRLVVPHAELDRIWRRLGVDR